jgi:hypothetical protein
VFFQHFFDDSGQLDDPQLLKSCMQLRICLLTIKTNHFQFGQKITGKFGEVLAITETSAKVLLRKNGGIVKKVCPNIFTSLEFGNSGDR